MARKKRASRRAGRIAARDIARDEDLRKVQPKLRMVANGSEKVNVLRSDQSSVLACDDRALLEQYRPPAEGRAVVRRRRELPVAAKRGSLRAITDSVRANVLIETIDTGDGRAAKRPPFPGRPRRKGNVIAATVTLRQLREIAQRDDVSHISFGEPITAPTPVVSPRKDVKPTPGRWRFGGQGLQRKHQFGKNVLIGIIDVHGFDFAHPDFLDEQGGTRFLRIWDQGGDIGGSGRPHPTIGPRGAFSYGSELLKKHMDRAIRASGTKRLPAYELEPQSQMLAGAHGTHVASIAAGNHGVCSRASIAAVLISIPSEDLERRRTFADSTRIIDAVEYLIAVAAAEKCSAVSINISLGTNGHAHDASGAVNRWLDNTLAVPGRSICVAAGNAGQEVPEFEGDRGYIMGRIHTSGRIPARGLYTDVEWLVVGNGIVDASENELEIWYGAQDRFGVSLRPPGAREFLKEVKPGEYLENVQLRDGSFVSIYNELYHPSNGSNYISIYLSPFYTPDALVGIPSGTWTVRLHGLEVRDGAFHGWIERDDPHPRGRAGDRELWNFPSFFSERSNVDNSSVSSLACGRYVIAVGNLDEEQERIAKSSSQGPTRDNRNKPEVAAPGTNIVAARGFTPRDTAWVQMSGTSMASPYVAGVAGLMLALNPKLTAAQIAGIMQRTSRPLPGASFAWATDAGFGVIDAAQCLEEAAKANERTDLNPKGVVR
ncbi:MAG TPA: S8 family serine peptidase [Gemmatimonadaceae bacterium]|nr:S8 family serine peptidase [Gemmatimonadaceae bacterium]